LYVFFFWFCPSQPSFLLRYHYFLISLAIPHKPLFLVPVVKL
jgi:hypothetical protein